MRKIIFVLLMLLFAFASDAQMLQAVKVAHVRQTLKKGVMKIRYDLKGGDKRMKYEVQLFISEDGGTDYSREITNAEGDIGSNVKLGKDREILWDTKNENLKDVAKIKFRLEARATVRH